jgi:hypothetical protein
MSIRVVADFAATSLKDETLTRASVWTHSYAYDWAMRNKFRLRTPAQMWFVAWCKDKASSGWFMVLVIFGLFLWSYFSSPSAPSEYEYQPDCYQEFGGSNGWVCD